MSTTLDKLNLGVLEKYSNEQFISWMGNAFATATFDPFVFIGDDLPALQLGWLIKKSSQSVIRKSRRCIAQLVCQWRSDADSGEVLVSACQVGAVIGVPEIPLTLRDQLKMLIHIDHVALTPKSKRTAWGCLEALSHYPSSSELIDCLEWHFYAPSTPAIFLSQLVLILCRANPSNYRSYLDHICGHGPRHTTKVEELRRICKVAVESMPAQLALKYSRLHEESHSGPAFALIVSVLREIEDLKDVIDQYQTSFQGAKAMHSTDRRLLLSPVRLSSLTELLN